MSIAFLTLILGFLLGKSTSDRFHHFKEHNKRLSDELLHRESPGASEMERIENAFAGIVRAKLLTNFNEYYSDSNQVVNNQIKQNFTSCIASTSFNTSLLDLEEFTKHLIREEYNSFIKCADVLKQFVQNIQ